MLRSPGWQTELDLTALDGRVTQRDGYCVLEWPALPDYYQGNQLVFEAPPEPGDVTRWPALFRRAFGTTPAVRHLLLGWEEGPAGEAVSQALGAAGFITFESDVLTAQTLVPPRHVNHEAEVRLLSGDAEWEAAAQSQLDAAPPHLLLQEFEPFVVARMARCRAMVEAGHGVWLGAFVGGELAGSLGLFRLGPRRRYQTVVTRHRFRKRGICARLVLEAAEHARQAWGPGELVIVADHGGAPGRLYRACGFREHDRIHAALLRPPAAH